MAAELPTGLKIRALRVQRGWTQDELAEKMATTKATISKIERSTMGLTVPWLRRFAEAFGVHWQDVMHEAEVKNPKITHVPHVGKIAAGNWREAIQDPTGWIPSVGATDSAFALTPDGDSMNMIIPEGAIVIIEPEDKELRDGKIYAIANEDGDTTVKTYRTEPARFEPRSTNSDYQPIMLGSRPFTVIGRVTQITQTV